MKSKIFNIIKVAFALGLFAAIVLNYDFLSNLDVRELISAADSLVLAAAIVVGIYVAKSFVFIVPASLVYISVGMVFETWQAIIISAVGIMLEIVCTYYLGRFLGKDAVTSKLSKIKAGKKLLDMKSKNKNLVVFTARFTGLPIDFSSLFMGAFDFKFIPYFILSMLGIMPRVVVMTIVGEGFYNLIPMKYIITAVIVAIPVCLIAFLVFKIIKSRKNSKLTNF